MPKFELKGKVSLDGSKWKSGLQQAEIEAERFSGRMATRLGGAIKASLIGAIVGGVTAGVAAALSSLGKSARIRDMASKIGVTPERMQEMEFAANQSGATGEQVVAAVKGLSKTLQRANELDEKGGFKNRDLREKFAKFGVTDEEMGLPPAAVLQVIGKRVGEGWNKKDALADIQHLMEESGVALLPVFKAGMEETMQRARELGTISGKDVMQLAALDDKKTDLAFAAGNRAATVTAATARLAASTAVSEVGNVGFGSNNFMIGANNQLITTLKNIERNTDSLR